MCSHRRVSAVGTGTHFGSAVRAGKAFYFIFYFYFIIVGRSSHSEMKSVVMK